VCPLARALALRAYFFCPAQNVEGYNMEKLCATPRFVVVTYKTVVSMDRPTVLHRYKTVPSVQITDRRFMLVLWFSFIIYRTEVQANIEEAPKYF
jgi:hypothetical protein